MTRRHLAFMLLIDLVWAVNVVAIKFAVDAVPPLTVAFARYVVVFAVCAPWLRWLPGRMKVIALTGLVAGALFFALGSVSFKLAENVSALAIAGQLGVPFALLLAVFVLGERIRWRRLTGIALAFGGVALLAFDPRIADERVALLLTVAASLVWAVGNLLFRGLSGVPVLTIHAWLALVSLPVLALASLILEPGALAALADTRASALGWIVFSALGASIVGHAGMSWLLQRYPVSVVAPLTLPSPLLSVVIATAVFATPVTPLMVLGGLLTLGGCAIITFRSSAKGLAAEASVPAGPATARP